MAIGDSRYTPEQKAAVIAACIDGPRRRSVPDVLRSAAAGTLMDAAGERRLDAFEGNVGTFRDYVARELRTRRREAIMHEGGAGAAAILAARLVAVGEREVSRLERRSKRGAVPLREIKEATALVRDLGRLSREAGLPAADAPAANGNGKTTAPAPADDLLADAPTVPAPIV